MCARASAHLHLAKRHRISSFGGLPIGCLHPRGASDSIPFQQPLRSRLGLARPGYLSARAPDPNPQPATALKRVSSTTYLGVCFVLPQLVDVLLLLSSFVPSPPYLSLSLSFPSLGTSQQSRGESHHRARAVVLSTHTAIHVGANRSVAAAPLSICGPATNLDVGDFACGGVTNSSSQDSFS